MQLRSNLLALLGVALVATSASAATVTYNLDLSVPGTFTITAAASAADNAGIAFYSVPLMGNVTSLDHRSPYAVNGSNFAPAGFNVLRTGDEAGGVMNPTIIGSQDVVSGPAGNLIYGFGQEASSFAAKGITPIGFPDTTSDAAWLNPLVLAVGTYEGSLAINESSLDLVANVFAAQGTRDAPAADVMVGGGVLPDEFMVDDLALPGPYYRGSLITGGPLATNDSDDPDSVAWVLESLTGPGGAAVGATVDPVTGEFNWQTINPVTLLGNYTAIIRGTNASGTPLGTDTGELTFTILIPEPASFTLLGLAMVGAIGFIRRR